MGAWDSFRFWGYAVAVALFLLGAVIIGVRALRSQERDRRLLLIVVTALTVFSALLITVFYFTNPYR
jgi:MFS-type transporter involved in bile tolerance (Atg22 family)